MNKLLSSAVASIVLLHVAVGNCHAQIGQFDFVQAITDDPLVRLATSTSSPQDVVEYLEFTRAGNAFFGFDFSLTTGVLRARAGSARQCNGVQA